MRAPTLVFLGAVVGIAAFVGCGSTGTSSSQCDPGCTGPGGGTSATSVGSSTTNAGGTGGAGGVATTSSTSSTASASGSTGTGSGTVCGGKQGMTCASSEYCDFPADKCSLADETGHCTLKPTACDKNYEPTCGCDGMVYGNPCEAAAAGIDISLNGTCTPPDGNFACGSGFCDAGTSYCRRTTSDVGGVADSYECKSLPAGCGSPVTCACLAMVPCGSMCADSKDGGGKVVTCPGG